MRRQTGAAIMQHIRVAHRNRGPHARIVDDASPCGTGTHISVDGVLQEWCGVCAVLCHCGAVARVRMCTCLRSRIDQVGVCKWFRNFSAADAIGGFWPQ